MGAPPRGPAPAPPGASGGGIPQPPPGQPPRPVGPPPFTPAWYGQHPDAWQIPKPYADWRSTPVPPTAVVNAYFGSAAATNPNVATLTAVEWLALGVFAPPVQPGAPPPSFQQIAVNKAGQIKGVMFDSKSNAIQPINGTVDLASRKMTWSVGPAGGLAFESSLDEITKPAPAVTVVTAAGRQAGTLVLVPAE